MAVEVLPKERTRRELRYEEGHGWTPTGGSALQQSKPFIMLVLLVLTTVLCAFVYRMLLDLETEYQLAYDSLLAAFPDATRFYSVAQSASVVELKTKYEAALRDGTFSADHVCDVNFFSNPFPQDQRGTPETLIIEFEFLLDMFSYAKIIGASFMGVMLCTKACVSYKLSTNLNRELMPVGRRSSRSGPALNLGIDLGDEGLLETAERRKTRVYLRSETLAYAIVNASLDVPVLTFVFLFYILNTSPKGLSCALCFARREVCAPAASMADLSMVFTTAIVAGVLSMAWNYVLILERWIEFVRFKKYVLNRGFSTTVHVVALFLVLAGYLFIAVTPTLLYFYRYVGPVYFDFTSAEERMYQVLAWCGVSTWGGLLTFVTLFAGIDTGEILAAPVLVFEVCEVCAETMDFCSLCCC
jgi:hypothetical protein